jgi:hypothetical protein
VADHTRQIGPHRHPIGDFNGDHTSDILWRNDFSGHVGWWEMHNGTQTWHDLGSSGGGHLIIA